MSLIDYRELPGGPRLKLVKEVKRRLRIYGISPRSDLWVAAWKWADSVAYHQSIWLRKKHWPAPTQIASQYVLIMLCEMKQFRSLCLPRDAEKHVPPEAAEYLSHMGTGRVFERPGIDTQKRIAKTETR